MESSKDYNPPLYLLGEGVVLKVLCQQDRGLQQVFTTQTQAEDSCV